MANSADWDQKLHSVAFDLDLQGLQRPLCTNMYSRLSLSRIPRDALKHFEISVPRHIRVERVRKTIN